MPIVVRAFRSAHSLTHIFYLECYHQNGWHERSWIGWAANNSLTDLHPTLPEAFKRAVPQSLYRLTPALRTLYLEAKKGTSAHAHNDIFTEAPTPASAMSTTKSYAPRVNVERSLDSIDQNNEGRERSDDVGHDSPGGGGRGSGGGDGGGIFHQVAGCEETPEAKWTDRQRTMCLMPDSEYGILRRSQEAGSCFLTDSARPCDGLVGDQSMSDTETRVQEGGSKSIDPAEKGGATEKEQEDGQVEQTGVGIKVLRPTFGEVLMEGAWREFGTVQREWDLM